MQIMAIPKRRYKEHKAILDSQKKPYQNVCIKRDKHKKVQNKTLFLHPYFFGLALDLQTLW